MITGLNHLTIAVKDLERSFSFYREVLGFTPLMKHSRGAYFLAGETWFCLDLDPATRTDALPEYTHFAFSVSLENFQLASDKISASGAKIWKNNKSEGESLYFLDPDGHKLEIHVGDWRSRIQAAQAKPWNQSLQFFQLDPKPNSAPSLEVLPELLAVVRLQPNDRIPDWSQHSPFCSISKTSEELSVVCRQTDVPENTKCEKNWRALKVKGPLDFGATGILAAIAKPLATAGISIFAISTFDTDYVLVKQENLERAILALEQSECQVERGVFLLDLA